MSDFLENINVFQLVIIIIIVLFLGILIGRIIQKIKDHKNIQKERNAAVKKSRAVIGGQFSEQLAPYLPNFPCNPGDVRFIGKPVDYIGFVGSAEGSKIKEILLIEVKTGNSHLSEREKQIKEAVDSGKVRYVEYRF